MFQFYQLLIVKAPDTKLCQLIRDENCDKWEITLYEHYEHNLTLFMKSLNQLGIKYKFGNLYFGSF